MATNQKPYDEQDIIEKLRNRSEIRRAIGRKQDGKPDRIADTCDEAANEIEKLRSQLTLLQFNYKHLLSMIGHKNGSDNS